MPGNEAPAVRLMGRQQETTTRRSILGAMAGATVTGGCVQRSRNLANRQTGEQVSLTIKTVPADEDRVAALIARSLVSNLTAAGIAAEIVPMREDEFRRDVLINHAFDIYIGLYPERHDPDFLRPLLHSSFGGGSGWQNPFGFTDLALDEYLIDQRKRPVSPRRAIVSDIQREFARQQPFTIVGFQDEIRAARTDRFAGPAEVSLGDPLGYIALRRRKADGSVIEGGDGRLRVLITDDRVTRNFNPIAVEFRNRGTFSGLVYDSLARRYGGGVRPWLAREWSWDAKGGETTATVRLREDLRWHDGTPLTATDVAFTYRFLADSTLGERETPVPAPRFHGRVSLVETVEPLGERRLRIGFGETAPEVAARAFTVPVLPADVWEPKATQVDFVGLDLFEGVTEALVWENPDPIGSGVLQVTRSVAGELLVLERFEDHFLHRNPPEELREQFDGVAFQEMAVRVVPSDAAAIGLLEADEADAIASSVDPEVVPRIGRSPGVQLLVNPSGAFYHVGFNARGRELSNQRFRRAVGKLVDKSTIAENISGGYLRPATVPLADETWVPSDLRWEGTDPEVPFAGSGGEVDVTAARDAFREAGYRYSDGGELLQQ